VYVPFKAGHLYGKAEDGVTGFHGRPASLALDKQGGLLIADDVGNTVWRVTAQGG
jgi:glucose/arabinose dehydrogenase